MKFDLSGYGIDAAALAEEKNELRKWYHTLRSEDMEHVGADFKGWVKLPETMDSVLMADMKETAKKIKEQCSLFVVIGIGGSYMGAKCVIDAMGGSKEGWPEVEFAGCNMSGTYLGSLLKKVEEQDTCICVISKSGRTVEPLLAYSILKDRLIAKYGEAEADRRIYVVTDREKGTLRPEVNKKGYKAYVIADDIGGRYSVLTPVGLLPIAAAGIDIDELVNGAADMAADKAWEDELLDYAASRVIMQNNGKSVEVYEYFEPSLAFFGEWLKQLYGESEGKQGKGAFPGSLCFSRDLHSIGQFLQDGTPNFAETMLQIEKPNEDYAIPELAGELFAGKSLEQINRCAEEGVYLAHIKAGSPVGKIIIPALNEYYFGQMIYFFEMSAALSGYGLGLNPFDQPGVEAYKSEMMKLIGEL